MTILTAETRQDYARITRYLVANPHLRYSTERGERGTLVFKVG